MLGKFIYYSTEGRYSNCNHFHMNQINRIRDKVVSMWIQWLLCIWELVCWWNLFFSLSLSPEFHLIFSPKMCKLWKWKSHTKYISVLFLPVEYVIKKDWTQFRVSIVVNFVSNILYILFISAQTIAHRAAKSPGHVRSSRRGLCVKWVSEILTNWYETKKRNCAI